MTGFYMKRNTGLKWVNSLSANPTKRSNTLKQFIEKNCLSVFDHFVKLALKGLTQ